MFDEASLTGEVMLAYTLQVIELPMVTGVSDEVSSYHPHCYSLVQNKMLWLLQINDFFYHGDNINSNGKTGIDLQVIQFQNKQECFHSMWLPDHL